VLILERCLHQKDSYPRTIANYVFDAVARRAILHFGSLDAVRVEIEAQTFKLYIKNVLLRYKKGGDDKLGQNVPTMATLLFEDADASLPGFPPDTAKIEVIWLPNEIWTGLEQVLVVARDGEHLIWEYEIKPPESGVIIPFTPPTKPEPDAGDLVKAKVPPANQPEEQ
jgi:hypothetical protein